MTDAPKIITSRFDVADGHALESYVRTGGYEGAQGRPGQARRGRRGGQDRLAARKRGGASLPASSGASARPGCSPRYLVVNGDESEPGTYKDHIIATIPTSSSRRPDRLLRRGLLAGLPLRAQRDGLRQGASPPPSTEPTAGYVSKDILGNDFSVDIVLHRAPAPTSWARRQRSSRASRATGAYAAQAPFFPAQGPLPPAHDRQQRQSSSRTCRGSLERVGPPSRPRRRELKGTRMFAVSGHVKGGVYEVEFGVTTFRDLLYAPRLRRRHPGAARSSRRSSPVGPRRRGSTPSTSTPRSRRA
ncbi:MAG: hypothetical protein R2711_12010 [Acidimicrobiales bacterium]